MTFVHEDAEFGQLVQIVARATGVAAALVEKDYWVTHTLWALHASGLAIWFKGGTSLSKGFGLIQRFSEDLDLVVEPGAVSGLPKVTSWKSTNRGQVARRRTFYVALTGELLVPGVRVERDSTRVDPKARGADYVGHYPGALLHQLAPGMSPFVRLEVGHARVAPYVERSLTSFVHVHLEREGMLGGFLDNRPASVRCVHPFVTLLEKLDAIARRYGRDEMEPDTFVRHYEDAAQIIRSQAGVPDPGITVEALAEEMRGAKDIAALPRPDHPSLVLSNPERRAAVARAYTRVAPMYWGERVPLGEACDTIRAWLDSSRLGK